MTLLAGFLLAALSFPLMPMKRWLPRKPSKADLEWDRSRWFTHNLVNEWVEWVDADPQWWAKCLAFLLVVAVIL